METNVYKAPNAALSEDSGGYDTLTMKQILFSFSGRVGRKTYWLTWLGMIALMMVLGGLLTLVGVSEDTLNAAIFIVYLPFIWVSLAVQVKRWHDRNKSGWWVFIAIIPIIGPLWALIENGFLAGDAGLNDYGRPSA